MIPGVDHTMITPTGFAFTGSYVPAFLDADRAMGSGQDFHRIAKWPSVSDRCLTSPIQKIKTGYARPTSLVVSPIGFRGQSSNKI